jgi:hypothetical protein
MGKLPKVCTGITYIIGCNHGIQKANEDDLLPIDNIEEIRIQRFSFRRLLEAIVTKRQIHFIGEEWGLPQPSIAQLLSQEKGIAWANINSSLEDLDRMGIPNDYVYGCYDPADKDRWNQLREGFMLRRIQESKGSAQNLAVVCGFHHMRSMGQLLANLSWTVETVDYRDLDWYRAGVFCDDQ